MSNRKQRRAGASMARTATSKNWGPWEQRTFEAEDVAGTIAENIVCAYVNNVFSVQLYICHPPGMGRVTQLAIRRHDGTMTRSWSDLQRIKNELVGTDKVALEIFPAHGNVVDEANMQHLWVMPDNHVIPFGLHCCAWGRPFYKSKALPG